MNKSATKLLVIDDEETLREGLRTYLEHEGYSVDVHINRLRKMLRAAGKLNLAPSTYRNFSHSSYQPA